MAQEIDARVRQKVDTLANWNNIDLPILSGEQAFVVNELGQPVNFRIGDGTKPFRDLPNWIQYDQAAYVAPVGNTLPMPQNGVGYSILTAGTYNGNLVVPTGSLGIADYVGNAWVVRTMEIPNGASLIAPASSKTTWVNNETTRLSDGTLLVANKNTTQTPVVGGSDWDQIGGQDISDINNALEFFLENASDPVDMGTSVAGLTNDSGEYLPAQTLFRTIRELPTGGKKYLIFSGFPMYSLVAGFSTVLGRTAQGAYVNLMPKVNQAAETENKTKVTQAVDISGVAQIFVNYSVQGTQGGTTVLDLSDETFGSYDAVKEYIDSSIIHTIFPSRAAARSLNMGVSAPTYVTPAFFAQGWQGSLGYVDSFRYIGFQVKNEQGQPPITDMSLRLFNTTDRAAGIGSSLFEKLKDAKVSGLSLNVDTYTYVVFDMGEVVKASNYIAARLEGNAGFRVGIDWDAAGWSGSSLLRPWIDYRWVSDTGFKLWCTVGTAPDLAVHPRIVFNRRQSDEQALGIAKYDMNSRHGSVSLRNIYSVGGREVRLFTNSVFSGLNPQSNFFVRFLDSAPDSVRSKGDYYLYDVPNQTAKWDVRVMVHDQVRSVVSDKTRSIFSKPRPTRLIDLTSDYPVWFFGDSLIHWNNNLIGKEFLRLINTNNPDEQIEPDGSILTPTMALSTAMRLVGEQDADGVKWSTINALATQVMSLSSPFINPASTQPNGSDAQGFPLRMDLVWYLQQICGQGKYPKFICFSLGVNDIAFTYGWNEGMNKEIAQWCGMLIGKIKDACDTIAGGTSNVSIAQLVHQFYPNNSGDYGDFQTDYQHRVWTNYYDEVENVITNGSSLSGKKLSGFARLIDASSRFDTVHGYTYDQVRVNSRLNVTAPVVVDTVHMGINGAYQYADAIADDFMYHNCQ